MTEPAPWWRRRPGWVRVPPAGVLLLAALAYLPALTAAPGRMPADSKLYLYLDPQRLVSDGLHSFDPRQFAGWVPHQHIAYLWPSGPWFSVFEIVGVPDWIAHRLWIGTLAMMAGLGVRWSARLLGLTAAGALAAAVVYQLSPYLLPYVSRTSVMLLPWAGLGWIVGLTMLATLRSRWRHAAALALVVLTVGAVNATALVMIVPAPALWLVHAVLAGQTTWQRAVGTALRAGALCVAVSLWWVAALVIQGRHGADVLAFSETLEAVSFTSTSTEVTRGLGYWLFYLRDPYSAATTAAVDHLGSGRTVAIGLLLVVVCVVGLAVTSWTQRRYASWLVLVGVVLAVGIHPIANPSPLMSALTGDGESGLALALRSSTRAVPVSVFGLALGAGALVASVRRWRWRFDVQRTALAAVIVLAVAGLPALWTGGFVDPTLERDQDPPAAWRDAARDLAAGDAGYRVLQVPGAEFGAFRWGYTVDQPLPGMVDVPLVTRDLLPLGSPPAMDLLYALDDRFQRGVLEPDSIAPVARLFGVDTVWLANDLAFERFRTPRPDVVADALAAGAVGLGSPRSFGEPRANVPRVEMVDEQALLFGLPPASLPPVQLLDVDDPVPVVRAKSEVVVLAGNGDGIVDAGAAGVIDGTELVVYAASVAPDELTELITDATHVIVTDTNRDRARHWRSSQDTVGFTEDGGEGSGVLRAVDGDARFDVFERSGPEHQTTAVQVGPVTARATSYGEPFAYRPEHRAAMAIDGDPTTAWLVADRFDAVGEQLVLDVDGSTDHLLFRQPDTAAGARRITEVDVAVGTAAPERFTLDERSIVDDGQRVDLDVPAGSAVVITIAAVGSDPGHPERQGAVGFVEVDAGLGTTTEVVQVPSDALAAVDATAPLTIVLTRERTRPTDRWRSDPETHLSRQFDLGVSRTFEPTITVRLDQRADDAVLTDLFDIDAPITSDRLTGSAASAGWAMFDGNDATAWTSGFGDATGTTIEIALVPGSSPGRLALRQADDAMHSVITSVRVTDAAGMALDLALPAPGATAASTLDVSALAGSHLTIEITGVEARTTVDRRYGEPTVLPVSLVAIEGDGVPTVELPTSIDTGCRDDLVTIDGRPLGLRVRADVERLLAGEPVDAELCGDPLVPLAAGQRSITTNAGSVTGLQVDRVVLAPPAPAPATGPATTTGNPTATVTASGRTSTTVEVGACAAGCWLVLGHGLNPAWTASIVGEPLPDPLLVDGGFNGWWLAPSDGTRTVVVEWAPQRLLTGALLASALAALACIVLVVADRRRRPLAAPERPRPLTRTQLLDTSADRRRLAGVVVLWSVVAALVIAPAWALAALAVGAVMVATRSQRPAAAVAVLGAAAGAALITSRVVRFRPLPDAGWVLNFADLHRPGLFVITAIAASAVLIERRPNSERAHQRDEGHGGEHGDGRLHRRTEPVRPVEHR